MRSRDRLVCSAAIIAAGVLAAGMQAHAQVIDRLDAVGPFLDACVTRRLTGKGFSGRREFTLRMSFRRDGAMIGEHVMSYSQPRSDDPEQKRLLDVMKSAFRECMPLPFSKRLGEAIAGKIFTFRYTLTTNKDTPA
jgi:hypothetical protein